MAFLIACQRMIILYIILLSEDEQRLLLVKELNTYGFDVSVLGVDKLKTFVHKKLMFSKNQNG